MQPIGLQAQQQSFVQVEKEKEDADVINDRDLQSMSKEEIIDLYKKQRISIISSREKVDHAIAELENLKRLKDEALAESERIKVIAQRTVANGSAQNAAANIAENQQNRYDYNLMQRDTNICTAGRAVSLVASIVMFIVSLVLFIV